MPQAVLEALRGSLDIGAEGNELSVAGVALRALLVYGFTLALIRFGSRRFLAKASAFDVIVAIMLGSLMARAINGSGELVPNLLAGAVLVTLHWVLALLAVRTDWLGSIIKGHPILLVKNGEVQSEGMRRAHITDEDLSEALRLQANHADPAKIARAYMERNGDISIVPQSREPRLWVISADKGIQTIRIELQ